MLRFISYFMMYKSMKHLPPPSPISHLPLLLNHHHHHLRALVGNFARTRMSCSFCFTDAAPLRFNSTCACWDENLHFATHCFVRLNLHFATRCFVHRGLQLSRVRRCHHPRLVKKDAFVASDASASIAAWTSVSSLIARASLRCLQLTCEAGRQGLLRL